LDTTYFGIAFIFAAKPALVLDGRPGRGEPVVGDPAEQLRIRRVELGELQLITLGAAVEGGPVSGRPRLGAARVLDDAVQGDELGDHDLAHVRCPFSSRQGIARLAGRPGCDHCGSRRPGQAMNRWSVPRRRVLAPATRMPSCRRAQLRRGSGSM
jgi:hypothetical protein